jgi:hypothetical protein
MVDKHVRSCDNDVATALRRKWTAAIRATSGPGFETATAAEANAAGRGTSSEDPGEAGLRAVSEAPTPVACSGTYQPSSVSTGPFRVCPAATAEGSERSRCNLALFELSPVTRRGQYASTSPGLVETPSLSTAGASHAVFYQQPLFDKFIASKGNDVAHKRLLLSSYPVK